VSSVNGARPTICLCMIVKNEAGVLARCLRSCRDLIDCWVICDTGSSDGTQALIARELEGVPGELYQHEWVDFGRNRSALMELAAGRADYLLLIDADMTVVQSAPLGGLTADAYMLRQGDERFDYHNKRLVRGDLRWLYVGATHEYLSCLDVERTVERLDALAIDDHGDGGSKADKFERDCALLQAELRGHPENARAMFYLAQTQRDLGTQTGDAGTLAAARDLYERRAGMGGWEEEVCCAWRQAGRLSAELDEWPRASAAFLAAWEARPSRLEAVHDLVAGLLDRRHHRTAHRFTALAARAGRLAVPEDILFVEPWVYRWGLLFQHSVAAYWCGEFDASIRACKRLLAIESLPDAHRRQAEVNMRLAFSQKARQAVERMRMPSYTPRRLAHTGTSTRGHPA
jgi:Glycosyl transferase family 2